MVFLSWVILFVLIGAFLWNMLIFRKRMRNMMRSFDIHTGKLAQQFLLLRTIFVCNLTCRIFVVIQKKIRI